MNAPEDRLGLVTQDTLDGHTDRSHEDTSTQQVFGSDLF